MNSSVPAQSAEDALWPPELDAMVVATDHHSVLFENDKVRVLDTHIPRGERTPVHTHRWAGILYILSWSNFVRRDDKGNVLLDTRAEGFQRPGQVSWGKALPPHSFENVGDADFHLISVEIKENTP